MSPPATLSAVQPRSFLELISHAKGADPEALDALFDRFYPLVRRMVHESLARDLRAGRPWLAARFSTGDVVQEVFRSVLKDISAFAGRTEESFAGYLAMVVRNRLIDSVRFHEAERRDGRRGATATSARGLESGSDDPAALAAVSDELARLHAALAQFEERERLLLRARFEGVESFQNLAEQLGYGSESAARRAFYAAQARLAILLAER
jgi:RNA polymerase sigma factor (sigma-70 family)